VQGEKDTHEAPRKVVVQTGTAHRSEPRLAPARISSGQTVLLSSIIARRIATSSSFHLAPKASDLPTQRERLLDLRLGLRRRRPNVRSAKHCDYAAHQEGLMMKRPQIFLSYSRKDSDRAGALEKALARRGLRVWRDVRSISECRRISLSLRRKASSRTGMRKRTTFPASGGGNGQGGGPCAAFDPALAFPSGITTTGDADRFVSDNLWIVAGRF
jgi:hypothetical protein